MTRVFVAATVIVAFTSSGRPRILAAAAPQSCESIRSIELANGTITHAHVVDAGSFVPPASAQPARGGAPPGPTAAFDTLPAFCRVAATLTPSSDSDIKVEVWMPASNWNGKFLAVGNGGWAGTISYAAMAEALRRGYATASTDTGHAGNGGAFVLGHPEKLLDFGYRAVHEMTVNAKRIVEALYGNAPRLSYWNGCSTGGRQGLMEAQRFPGEYNGMIVGAAATPRPLLNAWQLSLAQAALTDPAAFIPPAKYPAIHRAVVDACDALDGMKDGLINDPPKCRFDPALLACRGEDGPTCLTARQVETVRTLMRPLRKPGTEVEMFPGWEPGSELSWGAVIAGPEPASITIDHYRYVVFKNPSWDWRTFDVARDIPRAMNADDGAVDVPNPDLTRFVQRGGRMLMYHGWSDPLVPPRASVIKYAHVAQTLGGALRAAESARLFMVPGMGHCGGGEGPNSFDMIGALERWVERGVPPDRILASHISGGRVDRTRPLCPYPQVARYTGTGSTDDAENFVCTAARDGIR